MRPIHSIAVVFAGLTALCCLQCDKSTRSTNRPPSVPTIDVSGGAPSDQSTGCGIYPILEWKCSDPDGDHLSYDIFLGTDSIPEQVGDSISVNYFQSDTLEYAQKYYWMIVAKDNNGHLVSSPVWRFTTMAEPDLQPPSVSISLPVTGSHVYDTAIISAIASDDKGVAKVEFYIDSQLTATVAIEPWVYVWNTRVYPDSTKHSIFAIAFDQSGNTDTSNVVSVTVSYVNHPPNTHLRCDSIYINAHDENSRFPGVDLNWDGADSADWGRMQPLLQFEWRLYGPFEDTATLTEYVVVCDSFYDPYDNIFIYDSCPVLDVENLPAVVGSFPQPFRRSRGPAFEFDTTDVWVSDKQVTFYDLFQDLNLQETSQYKFVFWVRCRDDGGLPDPIPPHRQFLVLEPLFERSVILFDETYYTVNRGRWYPSSRDTVKSVFEHYIHQAGYNDFDATLGRDYFSISDVDQMTLVDLFAHKVCLLYNDDTDGPLSESQGFGFMHYVYVAVNYGSSAWVMARNLFGSYSNTHEGTVRAMSSQFEDCFGILRVTSEGWLYWAMQSAMEMREECIAAQAYFQDLPTLPISLDLLNARYVDWFRDTTHYFVGLPEVGSAAKSGPEIQTLYTYDSRLGDASPYWGKNVGVRKESTDMRTACFLFTPLATDPDSTQIMFTEMLGWLTETFGSGSSTPGGLNPASNPRDLAERRTRIEHFLYYLNHVADEEELNNLGVNLRPFTRVGR